MLNKAPKQIQLSKVDQFSIGTGLIGLVADVVSLASLFAISRSNNTENPPLHIWLLVLISIIYSVAAINFCTRRYFHKRSLENIQELTLPQIRRIEKATLTFTYLVNIPILISYFVFAFLEISSVEPILMYSFNYPFFWVNRMLQPFLCGMLYGGLLSSLICGLFHSSIIHIYVAFDPLYRPNDITFRKFP
jgi:hypothetical protein